MSFLTPTSDGNTRGSNSNSNNNNNIQPTNLFNALSHQAHITAVLSDRLRLRVLIGASEDISSEDWRAIHDFAMKAICFDRLFSFKEAFMRIGRRDLLNADNLARCQSSFLALGGTVVKVNYTYI